MTITATELKDNLGRYLALAKKEDIYITKNGHTIAKLGNPFEDRIATVHALAGSLKTDMTAEEIREERLANR